MLLAEQETGELREQFVAVLGHDLRNPLASISAAGRVLAPEVTSERGKRVLQLMAGSVSRMSGLIDNVLDFARGRLGGGIHLMRDPTSPIAPVIEQVIEELRSSAPGRDILSTLLIPHPVNADHARLGQLVSNLLGNAISHGDAKHPIFIDARLADDGTFTLSVTNKGKEISPDRMERLFEPFVVETREMTRDWDWDYTSHRRSREPMVVHSRRHPRMVRRASPLSCRLSLPTTKVDRAFLRALI